MVSGAIRPTSAEVAFSRETWCEFVRRRPEFRYLPPRQSLNLFTGGNATTRPKDDAAQVVVDGEVVGQVWWSMNEETLVNVAIDPDVLPLAHEWAAELGGKFILVVEHSHDVVGFTTAEQSLQKKDPENNQSLFSKSLDELLPPASEVGKKSAQVGGLNPQAGARKRPLRPGVSQCNGNPGATTIRNKRRESMRAVLIVSTIIGFTALSMGRKDYILAQKSSAVPIETSISNLTRNGVDGNLYVTLIDFDFRDEYVVVTKGGNWQSVWLFAVPADPTKKTNQTVLIKDTYIRKTEGVHQLMSMRRVTGIVTNDIESLPVGSYSELKKIDPEINSDSAIIVDVHQEVPSETRYQWEFGVGAGAILLSIAVVIRLFVTRTRD